MSVNLLVYVAALFESVSPGSGLGCSLTASQIHQTQLTDLLPTCLQRETDRQTDRQDRQRQGEIVRERERNRWRQSVCQSVT